MNGMSMNKGKAKKWKVQLIIFLCLFIVLEIVLRLFGMRAGTLIDDFIVEDNPVYQPRFISDEMGINIISDSAKGLMLGTVVNQQGFRSKFNYSEEVVDSIRRNTSKEIIMIVGDSYVEGCCPDTVTNSFPDILARNPRYCVLNFGIAGTDPLQYQLVIQKYLNLIKPDRVVVAIYFGNDILSYVRKPSPGVPLTYPFKNNKWLFTVTNTNLSLKDNYVLKTPQEAYQFFVDHYTLKGKSRNIFEKIISYSVCFSKVYLVIEHKIMQKKWEKMNIGKKGPPDAFEIANSTINNIYQNCLTKNVPVLFVGIPAPSEANEGASLKNKYRQIFKNIPWYVPDHLTLKDYDGSNIANHFNNQGHQKYAQFLNEVLTKTKTGKK